MKHEDTPQEGAVPGSSAEKGKGSKAGWIVGVAILLAFAALAFTGLK